MKPRRGTLGDGQWLMAIFGAWVMVLVAVPAFFEFGPKLERRFNPVISKMEILSIEPAEGGAHVTVRAEKYRTCKFLGIFWHRLDAGNVLHDVYIVTRRAGDQRSSTRPLGEQVMGPWFIDMQHDQVRAHSVVTLNYECHPLWTTSMEFYP